MLHYFRPKQSSRPHFSDFHKMIHADAPEKRQTRCKRINIQTGFYAGAQVLQTVGECVSQFNICRSAGFLNMITGNRNGIKFRHFFCRISKNIRDDTHRRCRRINIRIAHHKFFQNIILNRTRQLFRRNALFFRSDNIKC